MNVCLKTTNAILFPFILFYAGKASDHNERQRIGLTESECYVYQASDEYFFVYATFIYFIIVIIAGAGYGMHCGQYYRNEKELIEVHIKKLRQLKHRSNSMPTYETSREPTSQWESIWRFCKRNCKCIDSMSESVQLRAIRPYSRCSTLFTSWLFHRIWIWISCLIYPMTLLATFIYFTYRKDDINFINTHNPFIFNSTIIYLIYAAIFLCNFGANTYPEQYNKFVTKLIIMYVVLIPIAIVALILFLFQHRENLPEFHSGVFTVFEKEYDDEKSFMTFCYPNTYAIFRVSFTDVSSTPTIAKKALH